MLFTLEMLLQFRTKSFPLNETCNSKTWSDVRVY
jgi:hypothetical protein